jgi:membrane protein YdbS with pleckstrin-like domain
VTNGSTATDQPAGPPRAPRPFLERLGLAAVALVMAALFGVVALAAGAGGEWILAAMSAVGALMTVAVAAITLVRG